MPEKELDIIKLKKEVMIQDFLLKSGLKKKYSVLEDKRREIIDGFGRTLAEAILDEVSRCGRAWDTCSLVGNYIENATKNLFSDEEELEALDLLEMKKENEDELWGTLWERTLDDLNEQLNVKTSDADVMLLFGISQPLVEEFYSEVYGTHKDVADIKDICEYCDEPLLDTDIEFQYCGRCGEGTRGSQFWVAQELKECMDMMTSLDKSDEEIKSICTIDFVEKQIKREEKAKEELEKRKLKFFTD